MSSNSSPKDTLRIWEAFHIKMMDLVNMLMSSELRTDSQMLNLRKNNKNVPKVANRRKQFLLKTIKSKVVRYLTIHDSVKNSSHFLLKK